MKNSVHHSPYSTSTMLGDHIPIRTTIDSPSLFCFDVPLCRSQTPYGWTAPSEIPLASLTSCYVTWG